MTRYINMHRHDLPDAPDEFAFVCLDSPERPSPPPANVRYVGGVHPWRVKAGEWEDDCRRVDELAASGTIAAIGEIGLDRVKGGAWADQLRAFETQLAIAERRGLPAIIHCVRAFPELERARRRTKARAPWIVHGFRGKPEVARALIGAGMFLSFGAALLAPTPTLSEAFSRVPDDRFFLETDEAPDAIADIYRAAARFRGVSEAALAERTERNLENALTAAAALARL